MGFFRNLFKKKTQKSESIVEKQSPECLKFQKLQVFLEELLSTERYVARSEYQGALCEYQDVVEYFRILQKSEMLDYFCAQNGMRTEEVLGVLEKYASIVQLVDAGNEEFIRRTMEQEKKYLDDILKVVDPKILLDDDQRRVILTDEDYCLVIAGAGAGKTTTVAAKVKYLVEKKQISPKQILVVSFTNKAVHELREKINRDLKIECPIATFHSVGNAIIHKNSPDEKLNIVDGSKLYYVIRDYFRESVLQNESMVNKLIMFFASYFDAPYEGEELNAFFNQIAKANYSTLRSDLENFQREIIDTRTKKSVTIQNEILRSGQEVEIANFLYMNQIDYEYEPIYPYHIAYARKPYTPDFVLKQGDRVIYLEHFGISESGENDRYSRDQLEAYKRAIHDKIRLHRQHGTTLLYTFSQYKDGRVLTEHLKEQLEKVGIQLRPRSNQEVLTLLIAGEENRYIRRLLHLICRFITNFKVNGYTVEDFHRMYHSTQNVRTRLFLDICTDCYLQYEQYLKVNKAVDFQDMINESARLLKEVKQLGQTLDFKYIIVDEYQDISRQRFDLTSALSEVTKAKIIAVGDDWQSIYAFSGSDITLFTKFEEKMGYAKLLKIVQTYRNSQEVIDIAGNFIQRNPEQIIKTLKSSKRIQDPIIIYTYDGTKKGQNMNRRSGANYALAYTVQTCLEQIMEYNRQSGKEQGNILLLGRFGFDGDQLEKTGLFEYVNRGGKIKSVKYPHLDITFMTAHSSKGLGYDDVIILNGKNERYGFPSKIEDDPVLAFVIRGDRSIDYAEERRLFYVALTRTKNRVYIVAPEKNPSEFLLEIKKDYSNVVLRGTWNEEVPKVLGRKYCPVCGYPMQYKYKNAYGLRLFICTNEPEICSFMTNEYSAGRLSIMKCDCCRDGYLIVKPGKNGGHFLGCTNYQNNGIGCNRIVAKEQLDANMEEAYQLFEKTEQGPQLSNKKQSVSAGKIYPEETIVLKKPEQEEICYNGYELNHVVYTILQALQNMSKIRFYGVTMLLDILRGSESKRILEAGLNSISEYGSLEMISREELRAVVEWMLDNHLMLKTKGQYPVLHPTYDGNHYDQIITVRKMKKLRSYLEESFGEQ